MTEDLTPVADSGTAQSAGYHLRLVDPTGFNERTVGHDTRFKTRIGVAFWKNVVRGAVTPLFLVVLGLAACSGAAAPTAAPQVDELDTSTVADATAAELYSTNCQLCHGDREGKGSAGGASAHNETGHTWHHPDAQLKDWILKGRPGFASMPGFKDKLTEREVDAILGYIKTWWAPDQRDSQANLSRRYQEGLDRQNKNR